MPSKTRSLLILALVVIFTGIGAGLGGMLLALLLHGIQHLAYGYSLDSLISHETFLLGVTAAAPERRVLVLITCGLVAGVGWWLIYRYGRPLVSIKQAVSAQAPIMPPRPPSPTPCCKSSLWPSARHWAVKWRHGKSARWPPPGCHNGRDWRRTCTG